MWRGRQTLAVHTQRRLKMSCIDYADVAALKELTKTVGKRPGCRDKNNQNLITSIYSLDSCLHVQGVVV